MGATAIDSDLENDILQNPELYGLRRSHRRTAVQHYTFNDEDESVTIGRRNRKNIEDSDPELYEDAFVVDYDYDIDYYETNTGKGKGKNVSNKKKN